jgi:hypothetical protein
MKKEVAMRFKLILACAIFSCVAASGTARAASPAAQNLSHQELKKMMQNAHTPEDYLTLASYFRWRQQQFEQQAHDELAFWAERSLNVSLAAAKYPSPADSSKNRFEYFTYEAQKMSQQAAHFESLSANADR